MSNLRIAFVGVDVFDLGVIGLGFLRGVLGHV